MIGFFKKFTIWSTVIVVLVVAGFYLKQTFAPTNEEKNVVFGEVVRKDLLLRTTFAGVITSQRKTVIAAPYNGYLKRLYVQIGDRVRSGDPLVSFTASLDSFEEVHPLRAPFAGIVTLIRKSEGEFVKENDAMDYVMRIDDTSRFFVEAKVPEIDRLNVEIGQEAIIKASAISEKPFRGVVRRLSLAPDEKQQGFSFGGKSQVEYLVLIEITERDTRINPGMSAIIDVIFASAKNALTVGHEFIHDDEEAPYVVLKDGSKRTITVGLKNDEAVEVTDGLKEGDQLRQVEFAP